jgi:hypothetical protein
MQIGKMLDSESLHSLPETNCTQSSETPMIVQVGIGLLAWSSLQEEKRHCIY